MGYFFSGTGYIHMCKKLPHVFKRLRKERGLGLEGREICSLENKTGGCPLLCEKRDGKRTDNKLANLKSYTPFAVVSELHKTPLCKLSLHMKGFFDALLDLHHTPRLPILLWHYYHNYV